MVGLNVDIDSAGDNFFKKLASTFKEADWSIGFGEAIVGLVRFVDDYYHCLFPWVYTCCDG